MILEKHVITLRSRKRPLFEPMTSRAHSQVLTEWNEETTPSLYSVCFKTQHWKCNSVSHFLPLPSWNVSLAHTVEHETTPGYPWCMYTGIRTC